MRRKSEKTKIKLNMGEGTGANYKPWIQVGEFGSQGTAVKAINWLSGRTVHLLSQCEYRCWLMFMWDDDNIDIREQFPLDKKLTELLADKSGIKHPTKDGNNITMTTDFLVTRRDGNELAISVKPNLEKIQNSNRTIEKLFLEMLYWKSKKVEWKLVTEKDIDITFTNNIRDVTQFYNEREFMDEITFAKFLIAHKLLIVDMHKELNYREIIKTEDFKLWTAKAISYTTL